MKPSRNSPCHCNSGKKYKKCCLRKDEEAEQKRKREEHEEFLKWFEEDCALGQQRLNEPEDEWIPLEVEETNEHTGTA